MYPTCILDIFRHQMRVQSSAFTHVARDFWGMFLQSSMVIHPTMGIPTMGMEIPTHGLMTIPQYWRFTQVLSIGVKNDFK